MYSLAPPVTGWVTGIMLHWQTCCLMGFKEHVACPAGEVIALGLAWEKVEGEEGKNLNNLALLSELCTLRAWLTFVPELSSQHLLQMWWCLKEVWKQLWKLMALPHRACTFSVNVSGTLNYFLLIVGVLIALMSCRGCELAAPFPLHSPLCPMHLKSC